MALPDYEKKNPNSLQIEKFPTKSKKILKNLNHLLTWMEFLNDPLLYFIVPKTIKMSCMMRAKKAISLAAARGVIVAPACNSGVQRLKKRRCGDKYTSKDQGYNCIRKSKKDTWNHHFYILQFSSFCRALLLSWYFLKNISLFFKHLVM